MPEQIKIDRSYLRNSSMTIAIAVSIIAAVTLAMSGLAEAQASRRNVPSSNGSFGPIKQIDAGLLNVGYIEAGPTDGTPVILLHGWLAIFDLMRIAEGPIRYPVPWALTEETSFVAYVNDCRETLTAAGFHVTHERHRGEFALEFTERMMARVAQDGPPALGFAFADR